VKLLVFGASGRTGRLVVDQAIQRRHEVTAFVRDASKQWYPDTVRVLQGDPRRDDAVEDALAGQEAVISAIGPIAGKPTTEVSEVTRTIVEAMERLGPRRIVLAANAKVFTDDEVTGEYANVALEHRRNVAILRESRLAWTVLATPFLVDDAPSAYTAAIEIKAPGRSVTRTDLATALLDALERGEWIGHVVGIANPPA
jgi:putative NADH-flavin reductase